MYDPNHPDNIADQIMIYALVSHLVYGANSRKDAALCSYTIDESHPFVRPQYENSVHPSAGPVVIRMASLIVQRMVSVLGVDSVAVPYFIDPDDCDEGPQIDAARDVLASAVIAAYTYSQSQRGEDAHGASAQLAGLMGSIQIAVAAEVVCGVPVLSARQPGPDDHYRMQLRFHALTKDVSG